MNPASPIWYREFTVAELNAFGNGTMSEILGMEFTEIGPDWVEGRMPVDRRTHQPYGILHGGASVALAETLGSVAGMMTTDPAQGQVVGLDINANHLRSVRDGWVIGRATPIQTGRTVQVWEIRIRTAGEGKPVCISRLTLAVRPARPVK